MQKTVLNEVFDLLQEHKLVSSESEFSRDWLGRSESYLRGLRFHNEMPSISSIAVCASKLRYYGQRLAQTGHHAALAERFNALSDACHSHINERSTEIWLLGAPKGSA
ncbi:hypothetical protein J7481_22840 [Labrenzia sp. R4_2]|uniref:DUF6626 family protein n=1 Tax=Labrenzia sp. R4_2 TaxID=2821107 RepID=UPI001AD9D39E|nr:DUF6626 family protein [Labrenzia sp. R4_2]MBO9422366.1 hypothetical protein [Labrenzia sp. R4_2]